MRFARLVTGLVGLGLVATPAAVLTAPATAAEVTTTQLQIVGTRQAIVAKTVEHATRLSDSGGAPVAGQQVALQRRIAGTTSWAQVGRSVTDGGGIATFSTTAKANARYRTVFAGYSDGVTDYAPSQSVELGLKVYRNLGARFRKVNERAFVYYGKISPRYAGQVVTLERKTCKTCRYKVVDRQRANRYSKWSFRATAKPTRGFWWYRVSTRASTQYQRTWHVLRIETRVY